MESINCIMNNFRVWIGETRDAYQEYPLRRATLYGIRGIFNSLWFAGTSRYSLGTNIYSCDWDALLILDGCRVDAMEAVSGEYDFITSVDSIWSVGSASHEWIVKTFTNNYMNLIQDTTIISTNPFAKRVFFDNIMPPYGYSIPFNIASWNVVDSDYFHYSEWLTTHVDPYLKKWGIDGPTSAEYPTDRAILAGREQQSERMIVHYFQPHRPFISDAILSGELSYEMDNPYEAHQQGKLSREELYESYLENLRYVLNDVGRLLQNLDAEKVVITSDHGELMGEWGAFGHPEGIPHPALKKVPWVETTASDEQIDDPDSNVEYEADHNIEEKLRNLGYL